MRHNLLIHTLTVLLCSLLVFTGLACRDLSEQDTKQVKQALQDSLLSVTESWDVTIKLLDNGNKALKLEGKYATTYAREDTQITRIKGPVHISVYDSLGNITTKLTSERAVYQSNRGRFEFFENVNVYSRKGRTLNSEYLKWNRETERISTPRFVTITTPNDSISGRGFVGSVDLNSYRIKHVTGRVTLDTEKDTVQ